MNDMPRDLPRLWTLHKCLLMQLAAVERAIKQAENGVEPSALGQTRWVIMWRYTPKGTPRLGVLHVADCWMGQR
jgi:hypothetical protein